MTMRPDQPAFNPSSKKSPWTKGDIPRRQGSCNVLLIAPHGHRKDDGRTYSITKNTADKLGSYAIINKTYRKPTFINNSNGKRVPQKPNKSKKLINLNRKNQVDQHLGTEFRDPLSETVQEIIQNFGNAIVVWIHGMKDENLTPKNTFGNRAGMDALIGIGQGEPDSLTATKKTVDELIAALQSNPAKPIKAALAKKGSNFCGWHENIMNQFFRDEYGRDKVESIQIEIKRTGFREFSNHVATAEAIANAISKMTKKKPQEKTDQPSSDNAVQNAAIQEIKAGEIDLDEGQFKLRIDEISSDSDEFDQLVESIQKNKILNNIIVRKSNDGNGKPYQLISGFRRMTALKAALSENGDFANATVPARILDATVSNDEAYRISFTENLARKDLSLWEIAQACAEIKKKMEGPGKANGEIEKHIADLIQKDDRTVRRYLKLASIQDEKIKAAVHSGNISPTIALEIGKKDLVKDDPDNISALLNYLNTHPKTTRQFENTYINLEYCCDKSKMSLAAVLACKNADEFLSFKRMELEKRVEHLRITTGKEYPDIFKGKAGSLVKDTGEVDAGLERKKAADEFKKNNKAIIDRVQEAFRKTNVAGKFKIKPAPGSGDDHVTVTITVPKDQIWQAFDAVSRANNPQTKKVMRKKVPKTQPLKVVSTASKNVENPETTIKDESKTVYRGSFKK